jgi:DNA-binding NarL/FixJ family response regulator
VPHVEETAQLARRSPLAIMPGESGTKSQGSSKTTEPSAGQQSAAAEAPGVLLIGFRPLAADSLRHVLRTSQLLRVVHASIRRDDALRALAAYRPQAALVAWEAVDVRVLRRMAVRHPETGIVVLARFLTPEQGRALACCGAAATLRRDAPRDLLIGAMLLASRGMRAQPRVDPSGPSAWPNGDEGLASLSNRETEILGLLDCGESPAAIAELLGISRHTVKAQIRAVYRKLGVHSRADLHRVRAGGEPDRDDRSVDAG